SHYKQQRQWERRHNELLQRQREQEQHKRELKQHQRQQLERERQPPPLGFTIQHTFRGHTDAITSIAWSPDGDRLATASFDKTIRRWEVQSGTILFKIRDLTDAITSIAWSPDGDRLATTYAGNTIRLWNVQDGSSLTPIVSYRDDEKILLDRILRFRDREDE